MASIERSLATQRPGAGLTFLALCYQVLLGRELDADSMAEERRQWSVGDILRCLVTCDEFNDLVLFPLRSATSFSEHLFAGRPSPVHRFWVAEYLPVSPQALEVVSAASTWREILTSLVGDQIFMSAAGLEPMADLPDPAIAETSLDHGAEDETDYGALSILGAVDPDKVWN